MADLARERYMLIDDSVTDDDGNKVFNVLPWESVVYGTTAGMEMVSMGLGSPFTDDRTDHQIRGIQFISAHKFAAFTGVGGIAALPKA